MRNRYFYSVARRIRMDPTELYLLDKELMHLGVSSAVIEGDKQTSATSRGRDASSFVPMFQYSIELIPKRRYKLIGKIDRVVKIEGNKKVIRKILSNRKVWSDPGQERTTTVCSVARIYISTLENFSDSINGEKYQLPWPISPLPLPDINKLINSTKVRGTNCAPTARWTRQMF